MATYEGGRSRGVCQLQCGPDLGKNNPWGYSSGNSCSSSLLLRLPGPGQQQDGWVADPSPALPLAVGGELHCVQLESDLNTPPAQRGILDFIN